MNKNSKIYIAGHKGLVGSAILRNLEAKGYSNFLTAELNELDLRDQSQVDEFFSKHKPEYVFLAAAKVGGIMANNIYRAEFIYDNIMIQSNVIHSAHKYGAKKLLFLGSSCIYPKLAPQPLKEEYLLTGLLEETNEPYAIAKISGIKMCESYFRQYGSDFISVMPTNLYGPNDNFDLEKSHVLPALIRKFHLAKSLEANDWTAIRKDIDRRPIEEVKAENSESEITEILSRYGITKGSDGNINVKLWGSGKVYREFLYVDDMADACVHTMEKISGDRLYNEMGQTHINVGTGIDLTIKELAETVRSTIGSKTTIEWDTEKPDGTPKKQLDVALLKSLGWEHNVSLDDGILSVYKNYLTYAV